MDALNKWFQFKSGQKCEVLQGIWTSTYEVNRCVGPRNVYAKLTLSISPAEEFSFVSEVNWPNESYDDYVLYGVLDALIGVALSPRLEIRILLKEIGWDDVGSAPIAYYDAAKAVMEAFLKRS